jgi:hypothetical protein
VRSTPKEELRPFDSAQARLRLRRKEMFPFCFLTRHSASRMRFVKSQTKRIREAP